MRARDNRLVREAHARGELALAGAHDDPTDGSFDGAVLVFKTSDPAVVQRFVDADPIREERRRHAQPHPALERRDRRIARYSGTAMPIVVTSAEDRPYGAFHPASRDGFYDHGRRWSSVAAYVLASRVASADDREKLSRARDEGEATELAAAMATIPNSGEHAEQAYRHAFLRTFESNLALRQLLIDTGEEAIEVRGVEEGVGRWLMDVRAVVRRRAEDPGAIQCEHQDREAVRVACEDVLVRRSTSTVRRFTGRGGDFELLCPACLDRSPERRPLRKVCSDCFSSLLVLEREPDAGAPAVRERPTSLRFEHAVVRPLRPSAEDVLAIAPITGRPGVWLMLDRTGGLHRVDLDRGAAEAGGALPEGAIDLGAPIDLHVAPDGRIAAAAERTGLRAVVLLPTSGAVTMSLVRDGYHSEHCRFPLALFELEGRLLLAHATAWNRLDVSDPATGELLSAREFAGRGDARPEHYLDYFHAGLTVSPDGHRVIDDGWVWAPSGAVRVFSLKRWIEDNPFESEDGPSVQTLCWRDYFWDGPVCWIGDRTVAVWGDGEDDVELTPAARIFDAETGEELRSFPGPARGFAGVPPYLVAYDGEQGAAVWDITTGERLARDPSLVPDAYHPGSRAFVTRVPGEGFRVSRLLGEE